MPLLNLPSESFEVDPIYTRKPKRKRRQQSGRNDDVVQPPPVRQQIDETNWNAFYLHDDNEEPAPDDDNGDNASIQLNAEGTGSKSPVVSLAKESVPVDDELENRSTATVPQSTESVVESPIELNDGPDDEADIDNQTFDSLYDDVFEIELPNTLWGLHRDPDRKFIVFSEFDLAAMQSTKYLYVNHRLVCKTYVHGQLIVDEKLEQIGVDVLSELITILDEARICAKFREANGGTDCKVVTNTHLDSHCSECSVQSDSHCIAK